MWPPLFELRGGARSKRPPFFALPVNAVGEDSVGLAQLVANGDFASDTLWTKTTWTIGSGVASIAGAATDTMTQAIGIAPGERYLVTFTVTARSAGSVTPVLGGTSGTARSGTGTFSEVIVAGSTDSLISLSASGATLSIDNVTVTRA